MGCSDSKSTQEPKENKKTQQQKVKESNSQGSNTQSQPESSSNSKKCDTKNFTKEAKLENGETYFYFDINSDKSDIILFIHGFGGNKEIWNRLVTLLANDNFRMIVPDIRGHGQSSYKNVVTEPADLAKDFKYLFNAIGISQIHTIIG